MDGFYISGEPDTITYAALKIGFLRRPEITQDWNDPNYDEAKLRYYDKSDPMLHVTFNQVDMDSGDFNRVTRVYDVK